MYGKFFFTYTTYRATKNPKVTAVPSRYVTSSVVDIICVVFGCPVDKGVTDVVGVLTFCGCPMVNGVTVGMDGLVAGVSDGIAGLT